MQWGLTPEPVGSAIPAVVAAVLFILPAPAPLFAQSSPPADRPPPTASDDALDWRETLTGDARRPDDPADDRPTDAPAATRDTPAEPAPPSTGTDLGGRLLQMLLVLAGVCALAYAVLRWGVHGMLGAGRDCDGPIEVVARRQLDADTAILVVRIGPHGLVLGDGDQGLTRLDTLDGETLDEIARRQTSDADPPARSPFSSLWELGAASSDKEGSE